MARIAGVDLPPRKRAEIGLTYIYGIGRSRARSILYRVASLSTVKSRISRRRSKQYPYPPREPKAQSKAISGRKSR